MSKSNDSKLLQTAAEGQLSTRPAKTPCIGICSTTSVGDKVCRGCKRYSDEVIAWNGYDEVAKQAILRRIEKLTVQILENRFRIFSPGNLQEGLKQWRIPFDPSLSPYCWLHNFLKKGHGRLTQGEERLEDYGVYVLAGFNQLSLAALCEQVEAELLMLNHAHYERYLQPQRLPVG